MISPAEKYAAYVSRLEARQESQRAWEKRLMDPTWRAAVAAISVVPILAVLTILYLVV